jgi:hypothetical protein
MQIKVQEKFEYFFFEEQIAYCFESSYVFLGHSLTFIKHFFKHSSAVIGQTTQTVR